jgi:hypothetical protein
MREDFVQVKRDGVVEVRQPDFQELDGLLEAQDLRPAGEAKRSMSGDVSPLSEILLGLGS